MHKKNVSYSSSAHKTEPYTCWRRLSAQLGHRSRAVSCARATPSTVQQLTSASSSRLPQPERWRKATVTRPAASRPAAVAAIASPRRHTAAVLRSVPAAAAAAGRCSSRPGAPRSRVSGNESRLGSHPSHVTRAESRETVSTAAGVTDDTD